MLLINEKGQTSAVVKLDRLRLLESTDAMNIKIVRWSNDRILCTIFYGGQLMMGRTMEAQVITILLIEVKLVVILNFNYFLRYLHRGGKQNPRSQGIGDR